MLTVNIEIRRVTNVAGTGTMAVAVDPAASSDDDSDSDDRPESRRPEPYCQVLSADRGTRFLWGPFLGPQIGRWLGTHSTPGTIVPKGQSEYDF